MFCQIRCYVLQIKLSNKNSKDNFSSIHSTGSWGGEESGGGKEYLWSGKTQCYSGVGKERGKIYTKALLKRTKNNESRPGVYAAFVMVFQSTHIMLSLFHTMYHQYIFSRTFLLCGIGPRRKTARIPSSVYQPG